MTVYLIFKCNDCSIVFNDIIVRIYLCIYVKKMIKCVCVCLHMCKFIRVCFAFMSYENNMYLNYIFQFSKVLGCTYIKGYLPIDSRDLIDA